MEEDSDQVSDPNPELMDTTATPERKLTELWNVGVAGGKERMIGMEYCSSIDALLLVMSDGDAYIVDSACESPPTGPIPVFIPDQSMNKNSGGFLCSYIGDGDCVVLVNGPKLSCRHTYNGTILLKTALKCVAVPDESINVHLEYTLAEGQKLNEFIKMNESSWTETDKNMAEIVLGAPRDLADTNKWSTFVTLCDLGSLYKWLGNLVIVAKDTQSDPVVPVICAMIERLNQQRYQPYSFELTADGAGLDKSVMVSEAARRMTFTHWPHMNYKWALPDAMAEAGFYHQPNTTGDDRVLCFMCSVCLVCWEPSDEPWSEHERHTPNCPFVRGESTCNVPVGVSLSALPTVLHNLPTPITCISTVLNTDWLSVSTQHGNIQLYNSNALPQKAVNLTIDLNDAYLCMKTGYMHEPKKPPRVKWSDDAGEKTMSNADSVVATSVKEVISDITDAEIASELETMCASQEDIEVTCMSCVGRGSSSPKSTYDDSMAGSSLLIIGAGLDQARINRPSQAQATNINSINATNISGGAEASISMAGTGTRMLHPFIFVYAIEETGVKAAAACNKSNVTKRRSDGSTVLNSVVDAGSVLDGMDGFSESDDQMDVIDQMEDVWPVLAGDTQPSDYTVDVSSTTNPHTDLLQVQYEPPSASLLLLHCLRLPCVLDKPTYRIHSIVPCSSGVHVLVIVNSTISNSAALLLYPINFNATMPELIEVASRQHILEDIKVVSARPLYADGVASVSPHRIDWLAIVDHSGSVRVLDLDTGNTVSSVFTADNPNDPYVTVTPSNSADRLCVGTENGRVVTLQLQEHAGQGSETLLETCVSQITHNPIALENSPILDHESGLVTKGDLTEDKLQQMWHITRTDSSLSAQFSYQVPTCFLEVLQQQRQRKNPQHYLRENRQENRHTKSWHIQPEHNNGWQEHIIELSLTSVVCVSHIDFKFCLHQLCAGVPNIEVTLLRKKGHNEKEPQESDIPEQLRTMNNNCVQLSFLKQHRAEIVAGPIKLSEATDFTDLNGLIQFATPAMQMTGYRHYMIHVQALSAECMSQKMWRNLHQDYIQKKQESLMESKTAANRLSQHIKVKMKDIHAIVGGFKEYPATSRASSCRRSEDRKGCEWLDEVSITVWSHSKSNVQRDRLQRILLTCSWSTHSKLVRLICGDGLVNGVQFSESHHRHMAYDIISWLLTHWINNYSKDLIVSFGNMVMDNLEAFMTESYLKCGRSLSCRATAMLMQLLRAYNKLGRQIHYDLVQSLTYAVKITLTALDMCGESSGVVWLLALASELSRLDPISCRELTQQCVTTLHILADELANRDTTLHTQLAAKYGVNGLPMELDMFDWTPPVLHCVQQSMQAAVSYAGATTGPSICPTVYFSSEVTGQDDMNWGEMLGINVTDNMLVDAAEETPVAQPSTHAWFDNPVPANTNSSASKARKKTALSREHTYGLLEVEPLTFVCLSGSDGMRVENLETGVCSPVGNENITVTSGPGPIPLPDLVQSESTGISHPAMVSAVTSMKQQVQSILSKQMQLLALQQHKQKLQGKLDEHAAAVLDPQGSSASTFGVPTTPKTTPFMTPTPLSPSQLSPFNSEANLCFAEDNEVAEMLSDVPKDLLPVNLLAPDLLKQPSPQTLIVDRMNSGGRKCVLLDMGRLVVVTDVLIPVCSDLNSVSIDVWMKEEGQDGHRLLVCNDISTKALVLTDIQPPTLCRFIKFTYIGRHGLNSCVSKIPLGQFFGHRFITPSILDSCQVPLSQLERVLALQPPVSRRHLQQLCEDLKCKHRLCVNRLQTLLGAEAQQGAAPEDTVVKDLYKECMQMRLQWNVVNRVLNKLECKVSSGVLIGGWEEKCTDQVRCTAEMIVSWLVRSCSILAMDPLCRTGGQTYLTMPTALHFFHQLCTVGAPRLHSTTTVWLLQHGCNTPWWGTFFVAALDAYATNKSAMCSQASQDTLLMICYLAGESVRAGNLNVIVELMHYAASLATDSTMSLKVERLTCCLLLISSCIDVATGFTGKKRPDRWAFLAAEFGPGGDEKGEDGSRDKKKNKYARRLTSNKVKWEWEQGAAEKAMQLMQQQYDETVQLTEDIKSFVNGKPSSSSSSSSKSKIGQLKSSSRKKDRCSSWKHSKKKSRRSRLRLPTDVCVKTARALLSLLVEKDYPAHLSSSTALVLVKCIAKVCYESQQSLMLFMLVDNDETVEKLVSYVLDCRQTPWLRHAVTCLFMELAEIENKMYLAGSTIPATSSSVPKKEDWSASPSHSSSTTSLSLTHAPETPAGAQHAIEGYVEGLTPSPVTKTQVDEETRTKELKSLAKCQIHQYLNSGGPFGSISKVGSTSQMYEKKIATNSSSVKYYKTAMSKMKNMQVHKSYMDIGGMDTGSMFSWVSAPPPFTAAAPAVSITLPQLSALAGNPAAFHSFSSLATTSASTSSAAASSFANTEPAYAEAKETLSKLCEQIQMTTTPSIAVDLETTQPPEDDSAESRGGTPTEMGEGEDGNNTSFSSEVGTLAAATEAQQTMTDLDITRQLCIDIELKKHVDSLQPASFVLDERLECQLGWRTASAALGSSRLDDTALRTAMRQITPLFKTPPMPTYDGVAYTGLQIGSGVLSLSRVLTRKLCALTYDSDVEYVHRVLSFSWVVACALKGSGNKYSTHLFVQVGLSLQLMPALSNLLDYLAHAQDLSQQVWVLAFQLCAYNAGGTLLDCFDKLALAMRRFVCGGFGPMLSVPSAGPAAVVAFRRLLNCLNETCKQRSDAQTLVHKLKSSVLSVLLETLNSSVGCSVYGQQLDVISCLVEFLKEDGLEKCGDEKQLADAIYTFCRVAYRFLSSHAMSGSSVAPGAANPRLCHVSRNHSEGANKEMLHPGDRCDTVLCNLLNCASQALIAPLPSDPRRSVADAVLSVKPQCVGQVLSALCLCFTQTDALGEDGDVPVVVESPLVDSSTPLTPKTVGNWMLQVAFALQSAKSKDKLIGCLVQFLAKGTPLSTPFLCVLKRCLNTESDVAKFIELGGCQTVFNELLLVSRTVNDDDLVQCKLLKRIASVSSQVLSNDPPSGSAHKSHPKVDGLTNFSPQCQITSSSPMAHQLQSLLSSNTPHRRARQATWTYHFYPAETWLDMSLTLPYPVLLSEIQIRPHAQSLQTGPSAVQVELGADNNPMCLNLVGPPVVTHGCSKMRITTDHFPHPVQMVKLHLKRPTDSANMGMTQILLLGTPPLTSPPAASSAHRSSVDFLHWCNVLEHVLSRLPVGVSPATKNSETLLTQRLVTLLISARLDKKVCCQVQSLLTTLSVRGPVLDSLLELVDSSSYIQQESIPWINHLLYNTLANKPILNLDKVTRLWLCVEKHVIRAECGAVPPAVWSLVWALACIIWDTTPQLPHSFTEKHITPKLVKALCEMCVKPVSVNCGEACAWLMCSLARIQPPIVKIFIDTSKSLFEVKTLSVLGLVGQSSSLAEYLISSGVLGNLSDHLLALCLKGELGSPVLLALVELFASLCQVRVVREWLVPQKDNDICSYEGGGAFFLPLLKLVTRWPPRGTSLNQSQLQAAIVNLLRRCVTCDSSHQNAVSAALCSVLSDFSSSGLHGSLQEILIATLLEDETVNVLVEGFKTNQNVANPTGMRHPEYGCSRTMQLLTIPAVTVCKDVMSTYCHLMPKIYSQSYSYTDLSNLGDGGGDKSGWNKCTESELMSDILDENAKITSMLVDVDEQLDELMDPIPPASFTQSNIFPSLIKETPIGSPTVSKSTPADLDTILPDDLSASAAIKMAFGVSEKSESEESPTVSVNSSAPSTSRAPTNPAPKLPSDGNKLKVVYCVGVGPAPLGRATTVGELVIASEKNNAIHGPSFIHLKLRSITQSELCKEAKDSRKTVEPSCTLSVFAQKEGLALLAQHLQLYQPTFSIQPNKKKSNESKDLKEKAKYVFGIGANQPGWPTQGGTFDPNYYEDFEFMDYAGGQMQNNENNESRCSDRLQSVLSAGLSPHVVVAFSVMLRLPAYAQLLVSRDRRQAQRLLRLAMGVSADPMSSMSSGDTGQLSLVPFDALGALYAQHKWDSPMGKVIRDNSMDLGIVDILLSCLAAFSHQTTNRELTTSRESTPEHVRLVEQLLDALSHTEMSLTGQQTIPQSSTTPTERNQQFWAKGTGFGTGSTSQQWNVDLHVVKRKMDEHNVTCLLNVLASLVYPCTWTNLSPTLSPVTVILDQLVHTLEKSCIVPTLASYLRNDSVLDISRHTAVYEAALRTVTAIALCPPLHKILCIEACHDKSLAKMLVKFRDCIQVYQSKINPLESVESAEEVTVEEGLMKLVPLLDKAVQVVSVCIDSELVNVASSSEENQRAMSSLSFDQLYMNIMKPLQFETVNFFDNTGSNLLFPYHYETSVKNKEAGVSAPRVRRLAQESVTLSTSLPLSASSSLFVRAAEERLDVMKVLITGPDDTPYANGCYELDVFFPPDYPNNPMHVNLQTTGGHSVRFNPNLYNDGKVCLSVLNTWHGRPEERWNPHTSSFLQVLVSIQSLILVPDPYFNEPGYERSRGTPGGQQASSEYDANIRQANVRWAMLEMLRKPPEPLKNVIHRHFWLKKSQICKQIDGWIEEMESSDKRSTRNVAGYLVQLKRHYAALKEEFSKLEPPEGIDPETPAITETPPSPSLTALGPGVSQS